MNSEDSIAQYLETARSDELSAAEKQGLDVARGILGGEVVWEEPPADLIDLTLTQIAEEGSQKRNYRWLWAAAAAVLLVGGTLAISNLGDSQTNPPDPVAIIVLAGTELAPEANGTAGLIPTPNGWAIAFTAEGLPPAEEGTFYQGWVNNGHQSVAVGTFHLRGGDETPLALWSGVDLHDYTTLNVTLQDEQGGPEPSDRLVMTGTAGRFSDD